MTPKISDFQTDFKLFKAHLYPTTQDYVLVSHCLYNACASVRELKCSLLINLLKASRAFASWKNANICKYCNYVTLCIY